jgi:PncC family amidohydrolase
VVSEEVALEMARGAAETLGADVGLSLTGVAGPGEQDGQPVGTVWVGLFLPGSLDEALLLRLGSVGGGDREQIRQFATISALDFLRRRLMEA